MEPPQLFSREFLAFSEALDAEVGQLQRGNTRLEAGVQSVQGQVDNLKAARQRLEVIRSQLQADNAGAESEITFLLRSITANFADVPLPGSGFRPSMDSAPAYLQALLDSITAGQVSPEMLEHIAARLPAGPPPPAAPMSYE